MLNHITIMGRLTRDPEIRRTGTGTAVTSFTLAVERDIANKETGEKEVDFIDCNAWRSTAEFISKYFSKGSVAIVSGRLQIRNWTDKEGNKRRSAEVLVDSVYFGDSKKSSEGTFTAQTTNAHQGSTGDFSETMVMINQYQAQNVQSEFTMLDGDDQQLPF